MKPFNQDGTFGIAPKEVSRLVVRGAGATLLSSGSGLIIQIGSTVILARLLLPSDFGVVAMVTTFSLLALNFGLNGFTEAILQADEITRQVASNVFWFNIGSGLLLTLGFAAMGSYLAKFYSDPRVAGIALGVSLSVVFTSVSVVHIALLSRAMRFAAVSTNDLVARVMATVVSVSLAGLGWGYWALVAGTIALPLSTSIGAWWMCRWLPALPRRAVGTGSIVRFAVHTYGRFSLNYFARNIDNLLVGWHFGAVSLGFYKKAYDLFATPVSQSAGPLANVALAGLSRFKSNPPQYRRHLLSAISVLAFVGMGVGAFLTLVGKDLIRVLLGAKWEPAGHIFVYFGPGIGIMLLYHSHAWIHYSIGRADRALRWGMIEVGATVLLFLLCVHWGPVGIAVAWTMSSWLLTIPAFWYAGKPIGFGVASVLGVVWRYVIASIVAGSATGLICEHIHPLASTGGILGAVVRLIVTSILLSLLYFAAVILLHGGLTPLTRFAGLARQMLPFGPSSPPPEIENWSAEAEITGLAITREAH